MAKIDFKAMKNAQKAVEDKVEDNIPEGLEKSYTDLWSGGKETVIQVDISRLVPYSDENGNEQPFKINQKRVEQIAESAKDIGIVSPLTVISKGDIYQIISGHHRLEAAKLIGQLKVPCIVKNYTEDVVYKAVSEGNIQRDKTYPSEYAKIFSKYFKMRDDEDLTAEEIAKKFGVSRKTIYRYINVEKLIPELQYLVDDEIIKFNAVEYIKGFSEDVQRELYNVLSENKLSLTRVTAIKLRDYINELADEITAADYDALAEFVDGLEQDRDFFPQGVTMHDAEALNRTRENTGAVKFSLTINWENQENDEKTAGTGEDT